uniref:Uncharacterized protein n=1 Tax=Anguilla anguilla TaxID=7936 RepID=A0A0E9R608_ANGAN
MCCLALTPPVSRTQEGGVTFGWVIPLPHCVTQP